MNLHCISFLYVLSFYYYVLTMSGVTFLLGFLELTPLLLFQVLKVGLLCGNFGVLRFFAVFLFGKT